MSALARWLAKFAVSPTSDKIVNNSTIPGASVTEALNAASGGSFNASNVSFTPVGSVQAVDVQAAIAELDLDIQSIVALGSLEWVIQTASFNALLNGRNLVTATGSPVDIGQPNFQPGNFITIHNDINSTQTVRVLNPDKTIIGTSGTVPIGTNLTIDPGYTVVLVARTETELQVV